MRQAIRALLAVGLLLAGALPASAAVEAGPRCADIDNLIGTYDGTDGGTNADTPDEFGVILKAPSCPRFSYTIFVYDEEASPTPFFTHTWSGDGINTTLGITFQVTSAHDSDGDIYIYAESWFMNNSGKKVVLDRAPDVGLALATIDGATPGSGVKAG